MPLIEWVESCFEGRGSRLDPLHSGEEHVGLLGVERRAAYKVSKKQSEGSLGILGSRGPFAAKSFAWGRRIDPPGPLEGSSILTVHLVVVAAAVPRGPKTLILRSRPGNRQF